jgi:hypothetical protein
MGIFTDDAITRTSCTRVFLGVYDTHISDINLNVPHWGNTGGGPNGENVQHPKRGKKENSPA